MGERDTNRSIEDVLVAFTTDVQLDVRRIAGGHLGLCHEEGRADLAVQQGRQPLLLLGFVAVFGDDFHVSSVWGGVIRGL